MSQEDPKARSPRESALRVLSDVPPSPFIPSWHDISSAEHFWFRWRLRASLGFFEDHGVPIDRELRVLEVGCGSGVLMSQFEAETAWRVDGADVDREGLEKVQSGRGQAFLYDLADRVPEMDEAYDLILLYDVLEHIETTAPFIAHLLYHLKPGGHLAINVPALQWLHGRYDRAAGHHRRYDRNSLAGEFRGFGLEVIATRYWGLTMVPLLALRKLLGPLWGSDEEVIDWGFRPPNAAVDGALRAVMNAELSWLRRPMLGSSLLLLGRRAEARGSLASEVDAR